ncbi:hypothetical protein BST61_g1143 [Cercospora zeina]
MRLFDNSAIRIDLFPGRREKKDGSKNNKNATTKSNEPWAATARVPQGAKLQKDNGAGRFVKTAKSMQNMDLMSSQRPDTTRAYNSYDAERSGPGHCNKGGAPSNYTYRRPSMDRANHDVESRGAEPKGPWLRQRGEPPLVNGVEMSRNNQQSGQRPTMTGYGQHASQSGMGREPNGLSSRQRDESPTAANRTEMHRNNQPAQWTTPTAHGHQTSQSTMNSESNGLCSRQRNTPSPTDRTDVSRNNHAEQSTTATAYGQHSSQSTTRSEAEKPSGDQRRSRADIQEEIESDERLRTNIPLGAPHSTGHALKHKRSKADMIRATENMARTLSRSPHRSPANKRQREFADESRPGTSSSNGSFQQAQYSRSNSNNRVPNVTSQPTSHSHARDISHSRQRSAETTNGQNSHRAQGADSSNTTNGADNASPQYDGLSPTQVSSVAKKQGKAFNSTIRTSPPLPMEPNKTTWSPTASVVRQKSSEKNDNGRQRNVSSPSADTQATHGNQSVANFNQSGHQRQYSNSGSNSGAQASGTLCQPDQSTGPGARGHERNMSNGVVNGKDDMRSQDTWSSGNQPNRCQCNGSTAGGDTAQVGSDMANTSHDNDTRDTPYHGNHNMEKGSPYGVNINTNPHRLSTAGNESASNSSPTTRPTIREFSRCKCSFHRFKWCWPTKITESPWQKTFGGGRGGGDPRAKIPNHIARQQQQPKNLLPSHMRNGSSNNNTSPNRFSNTNAIVNNLNNSGHPAAASKNKTVPHPLPLGRGKKNENSSSSSSTSRAKVVTVDDQSGDNTVVPTPWSSKFSPDRQSDGHDGVKVVTVNNGGGSLSRTSPKRENGSGPDLTSHQQQQQQSPTRSGKGSGSTTDQGREVSSQRDSMDFGGQSTYSNNKQQQQQQQQQNGRHHHHHRHHHQTDHQDFSSTPHDHHNNEKGYVDSAVENVGNVMRDVGQRISSGGNWNTAQTVGGR